MQEIKIWFYGLKPRERWLVAGGGTLVLLVAVYTLALLPFYKSINEASERVARKQGDLAWIRSVAPEMQMLAATRPGSAMASNEPLIMLIDRAAHECGISSALTGQTPNGDSGIRVRLEAAAFDELIRCLGNLEQVHSVRIETAQFDRTAKPGLVNASIVITRGAS